MSNGQFPGSFVAPGDPGLGIGGYQSYSGNPSTADSMYGTFNPYGDPNVNQGFEVPGGGLSGFSPVGPSGPMGSASDGSTSPVTAAQASLGLSPGPGADTSGSGATSYLGGLLTIGPSKPGGCGFTNIGACFPGALTGNQSPSAVTGGATGTCGPTNIPACFPSIGDFATRAAIVVLGFIFVAAGLFMFGRQVPFVRHVVPNMLRP